MPELPDVEVFKRTIDRTALDRQIEHAKVSDTRVLECSDSTLRRNLQGHRLTDTHRHGKYLLGRLDHGRWLLVHFGMTGYPVAWDEPDPDREPDHVHLRLDFSDGGHLAYCNTRKLGALGIVESPEVAIEEHGLGPDAFRLGTNDFRELLAGRRGMVKSTLMNQEVIAGLGNVWTDEILFQARLHPKTALRELAPGTLDTLYDTMQTVLHEAIDFNVNPDDAPEHYLLPRRSEGEPCPHGCGGEVAKITVSGRAGYYCPTCQQRPD